MTAQMRLDIRTSYERPPIPTTRFDWCAWMDDTDETGPFGYGRTREEAVDDLERQIDENSQNNC